MLKGRGWHKIWSPKEPICFILAHIQSLLETINVELNLKSFVDSNQAQLGSAASVVSTPVR